MIRVEDTAVVFTPGRRLVVIDYEDREQVKRLGLAVAAAVSEVLALDDEDRRLIREATPAALREFANPAPPKPEEPTGLGAVVEDAEGVLWTRTEHKPNLTGAVWVSAFHVTQADKALCREWPDVAAVRVLSEGVTP